MEITWRIISREEEGGMGENVPGVSSINGRYKVDKEEVKII